MTLPITKVESEPTLEMAADQPRRYPGELVTLRIHWDIAENQAGSLLQVSLPKSMKIEAYALPEGAPVIVPAISMTDDALIFQLDLVNVRNDKRNSELRLDIRLDNFAFDHYFHVDASLLTNDLSVVKAATTRVAVLTEAKYLDHLPELYREDDLTARLLMLMESFWSPIEKQIEQSEHYYDPELTPAAFLPWLSEWIGFTTWEGLPEERSRKLLRNAMALFQTRGTLSALRTFLEITTEGRAILIERRANNFVLGSSAFLGLGTALGTDNKPDTITIDLTIPESELESSNNNLTLYRNRVSAAITEFIPANVSFDLRLHTNQA